jgi:hypothetical protein
MDFKVILVQVAMIATLTLGATQVLKGVFTKVKTARLSIVIAFILALATGTSILLPLGFSPAKNFVEMVPWLATVFAILFYIADLGLIALLTSKGANKFFDYFIGKPNTASTSILLEGAAPLKNFESKPVE